MVSLSPLNRSSIVLPSENSVQAQGSQTVPSMFCASNDRYRDILELAKSTKVTTVPSTVPGSSQASRIFSRSLVLALSDAKAHNGVQEMTTSISPTVARVQSKSYPGVTIEAALSRAFGLIMSDIRDPETPLSIIMGDLQGDHTTLRHHLNQNGTTLTLVPANVHPTDDVYWHPPEYGESIDAHWVFHLQVPSLSDHQFWVIVPRDGTIGYVYGFN